MKKNLIIFIFIAPIIALLFSGVRIYYLAKMWRYTGPNVEFRIEKGEGFSSINHRLYKEELISNPRIFYRLVQYYDLITKFKSGVYIVESNSNMLSIIDSLVYGKSVEKQITIPEGKNIYEVADILEKNEIVNKEAFLALAKDPKTVEKMGFEAPTIEGFLYPETYQFQKNSDPLNVISMMVKQFRQKTKDVLEQNTSAFTPIQILTLASIVEKETGAKAERPMIAGVFLNRIRKKMRLQSDPTTIYGIWENFSGNLKKKDLMENTPYNTYAINGLPIGPICNPGLAAIKAVLAPEQHQFLYFVSQNDGTHIFSENYKNHEEAVKKYQKDARQRAGKSWRDLKQ